jgi:nucleotide-binding universal stress UspA family protein
MIATSRAPEGEPAAALADTATCPGDVLVVGHQPALSLRRLVHGSVGRYLLGHARCPVVIVPAPDDPARGTRRDLA